MKRTLIALAALVLSIPIPLAQAEVIDDPDTVWAMPQRDEKTAVPLPISLGCSATYVSTVVALKTFDTSDGLQYLDLRDDDLFTFRMPFPFVYFNNTATDISVSSDGWLSFFEADTADVDASHDPIPDPSAPKGVIAPFWADFDPFAGGTVPDQRAVQVKTFGTAPNRILVVTWSRFPRLAQPTTEFTFQVALYETSNLIRFQYLDLRGDKSDCAVGIENEDGTVGYQYSRDIDPKLEGLALLWRPSFSADLDCTAVPELACGARATGLTMTGTDRVVLYGCEDQLRRAAERVFVINIDTVSLIDIRVTPTSPTKQLMAYLLSECNLCNCLEGGSDHIRTVVGPGRYYLAVDGPSSLDNGPFDVSFDCESLLGTPTGSRLVVGDGSCGVTVDVDRFGDGRGVISVEGWTPHNSDRNYTALRVDGAAVYATNAGRSSCTEFTRMGAWADDNTDKAVTYWQSPEADIIQTVIGREVVGCCGALVETRVINRDTIAHAYEFRELYATDFGAATGTCAPSETVEAGPLHVDPVGSDYTDEQDLSCFGGGQCATACLTPAELKSADDLATRLVLQIPQQTGLNHINAEWIRYFDANRVCDPAFPEPWTGAYLPTPDPNATCAERGGLLYAWDIPKAGGTLAPGAEETFTQLFGDGCRLDIACSSCRATADLVPTITRLCPGYQTDLSALGSTIVDCGAGTPTYEWLRNGASLGLSTPTISVTEPLPGIYTYTVVHRCEPPPGGAPCEDRRSVTIEYLDCASCSMDAIVTGPGPESCVRQDVLLSALSSVPTNCPGTVTYQWRRDTVFIIGANDALLTVNEAATGTRNYDVLVNCSAPPDGLACVDTSPFYRITWVASIGIPAAIGNSLFAVKSGSDVQLMWTELPPGSFGYYEILRGASKLELPLPGPPVAQSRVFFSPTLDGGAASSSSDYYYRVRAAGCPGEYGPY